MPVTLKCLGGARTVTGSSHLILADKSQVLLDAGLFQGRRDQSYQVNTTLSFNPRKVKAMVLSHAHIDHCGNIPTLIKKGMRCKVYATSATKDLAKVMLEDSGKIQEEDIQYVNKINRRLGFPPRKPLYTRKEALKATRIFRPLSYGQRFCIAKDVTVTLYDAGHILGSAIVVLDIKDNGRLIRLGYAVDLGRKNLPLINNPRVPQGLDYLILESTYGGRVHSPVEDARARLTEVINRTVARRGKIIIPAFSLERTQEVLYFLDALVREKAIPALPIYVDSPLATEVTQLFLHHLSYLNKKTQAAIADEKNPFEFINLRYTKNQEESKRLNDDHSPMVIIAGSGMCESGRILHHLKNNIEDSRNTVMVVGFMAKDTLGKKLVDRAPLVRIFGVEYELHAEVVVINSFSGHADKNELLEFVSESLPLRRIVLVHGEEDQMYTLSDTLSRLGLDVYIPSKDEEIVLD